MTFEKMRNRLKYGERLGYKYFAIEVTLPDCNKTEVIINPMANVDPKLMYYAEKYTKELELRFNKEIKIVSFGIGNTFENIRIDLILNKQRMGMEQLW